MTRPIFPVSSLTLTSSGSAVSSYLPYDVSSMKLPTQVVVKATGQGAYVRLSGDGSLATSADVLVQAGDHVVMSVSGRQWVSVLSDGASSKVSIGALSTGVWGNAVVPALNISFINATTLDSRVTFSRGTNATLTGSNGLIQYAPHNLLTNSEDFEAAAWVKTEVSVSSNVTVAPDGTTTADKFIPSTNALSHYFQNTVTSTTQQCTGTVYVKLDGSAVNKVVLYPGGAATFGLFNLSAVTSTGEANVVSTSITPLANGWYRLQVTWAAGIAVDRLRVYASSGATGDAPTPGNGTDGIFIWGAQLNVGSTAQSYNSTTPKNLLGFTQEPENAAWTKSNSYVQQNLLTWSQDFDNAAWTKSNVTVTANSTAAPDGTVTADTFVESTDAVPTSHFAYQSPTLAAGQSYTFTCYAKAISSTRLFQLYVRDFASTVFASSTFNLTTGTIFFVAAGTSSITNVGNGWYRLTVTGTAGAAGVGLLLLSSKDLSGLDYIGNGSSVAFIWGAQLVQGSTSGDYTQTTSAAAPTRYLNWDGTLTGRKLVEDTVNSQHAVVVASGSRPTIAAGLHTEFVYLKAGERTSAAVYNNGTSGGAGVAINLLTGVVLETGGAQYVSNSVQSVGAGWYKVGLTFLSLGGTSGLTVYIGNTFAGQTYTGDGTSGIYVSDFQLSNSASVDPYVYNPQAAAASAAFYGPRFDYDPVTLAAKGLLIEEQRTNLLTYSEQFDNAAWGGTGSTIAPNTAIAPSGAQSMDTLTETAVTDFHFTQQTFTATAATHTYSVYARLASGTRRLVLREGVSTGAYATFDLSSGTVAASGAGGTGTITAVGNNVYRCTVTFTAVAGTASMQVALTNGTTFVSYVGDGTSGVFIWGAQVELGSFATSYIPTVASQVTRNADSASMLGDNFYTWYNPNQGTTCVETSSIGANSVQFPGVLRFWSGSNNNRFGVYGKPNGAGYGAVMTTAGSNVALLDPISGSTATIINTVSKLAYAYKPDDFAATRNALTVTTDTSGGVAPVNELNIGLYDDRLNGYIRRIGYYNTRLPDSTLQALTV